MEEKFLLKMLRKSFLQYGRDLNENPLSKEDIESLLKQITDEKAEDTELYENIEDIVYSYLTN
ncbi:YqzH family protein [Metabacillus litoralis]|uniref:YqzH family protein n=1 Tax=Metabacillus litoralis TaxID=152268 RepID=UPI001CFDAF96|nr:YqzH family protein [Metabacillus litoralis]